MAPYINSAAVYDIVYRYKSYQAEVFMLQAWIQQYAPRPYHTLLDVACGTGAHLRFLQTLYRCEGLELSPQMIAIAKQRYPTIPFHEADMRTFSLGRQFDLVTCLFSGIGYMQTANELAQAVQTMGDHVAPGGLLIVEAWFHPGQFIHGTSHAGTFEDPETQTKVARVTRSEVDGDGTLSRMEMHHLVATPDGIQYFIERHEMGLFTDAEYRGAFEAAGMVTHVEEQGLIGRTVYLGVKPG
jgi:SAM-dependent methyltransferase